VTGKTEVVAPVIGSPGGLGRPVNVMMVATLVHGMTVVTGNTADFKATGVALLNARQHGTLHGLACMK